LFWNFVKSPKIRYLLLLYVLVSPSTKTTKSRSSSRCAMGTSIKLIRVQFIYTTHYIIYRFRNFGFAFIFFFYVHHQFVSYYYFHHHCHWLGICSISSHLYVDPKTLLSLPWSSFHFGLFKSFS